MRILAGDIGGTKTILQISDYTDGQFTVRAEQRFESNAFNVFDNLLQDFFLQHPALSKEIHAACIGVAGPVENQTAKVTNLPWSLQTDSLSERFTIPHVYLINDFQAVGYGIERLSQTDLTCLQAGQNKQRAVRAVIGAGTGLGQATLIWDDEINSYRVYASEAGHTSFAPTNEIQIELLKYLSQQYECVSLERVLSGPGIENIFNFLCAKQPDLLSAQLAEALPQKDLTPVIVEYAVQNKDPLAAQALDLFVEVYGAAAGNLALTVLPMGGVYIAGGIAPRITEKLLQGSFLRSFTNKSKMKTLLEAIPVMVINNAKVGLLGAANYAVKGELLSG